MDFPGGDNITGQITDGNWTAQLLLNRVVFNKTNPAPLAGTYTMVLQSDDVPMGNGIGTLSVDVSGNVKCSLTLPDGTAVSQKTTLSKAGAWPLYAAPYKSGGVVIGWMQFSGAASDGFDGQSVWTKPGGMAAPYASGLTNLVTVTGSAYKAPPAFHTFGPSTITFNGGGLSSPITNSLTWGTGNKVVSGKSLKLSLTTASGLFKGTVVDPATGHTVPFQGVLFEQNNVGLGFFPGANQSGSVSFTPNP